MKDEMLMEIRVSCYEPITVSGAHGKIVMIPFGGQAYGDLFNGMVTGPGVDTQKIDAEGHTVLSARYMLEGTDAAGNACRVFVENQGSADTGYIPTIVTDSPLLASWENVPLSATLESIPEGVIVRIFRKAEGKES